MKTRRSGILLHITSLPSPFGIGDLGPGAYQFIDFLADAKQSVWQVLPLNPSSSYCGNSPYCGYSAFAGNPLLISPERMVEEGFLSASDFHDRPSFPDERVSYEAAAEYKMRLLRTAYERFSGHGGEDRKFKAFCSMNANWLDDYALFAVLKEQFSGVGWIDWPWEIRNRAESAVRDWKEWLGHNISAQKFFQYIFFRQWSSIRAYCREKSIQIIGDIPIYVSYDSSDVWSHSRIFKLDHEKRPTFVAGVPPDYFSATGQLWGNPVYDWNVLRETGYSWWIERFEHNLNMFDIVRLDHFRGFVAYWEVPSTEQTAINGKWIEVPATDFFDTLMRRFPYLPILAEDLGTITSDVREIMAKYEFPGMKVLLFAFGEDLPTNPYAPHNLTTNSVVYTGTHDNNTTRGWFRNEASAGDRERIAGYLGREVNEDDINWDFIRLAMMSVSVAAVFPMQDILGLGQEARMNLPSVAHGNWGWRVLREQLSPRLSEKLARFTRTYGRV